jgi:hypothetical protein
MCPICPETFRSSAQSFLKDTEQELEIATTVSSSAVSSRTSQCITSFSFYFKELFMSSAYIHSFIYSSMALQPLVGPWPLPQFRNLFYTDGRTSWTSDQPVARPLPTYRTIQTQNKRAHIHTCLEWDSNPRAQCSSERRRFMP